MTATLTQYYLNHTMRKDASVYSTRTRYRVEVYDMAKGEVAQKRTFKDSHKANQFAARALGLSDELRKLMAYEAWCVEYQRLYSSKNN
jgi:hypothetical protein